MGSFKHILCCTDFSPRSERAFAKSVQLARSEGAALDLIHVIAPRAPLLPNEEKPRPRLSDEEVKSLVKNYLKENYLADCPDLKVHIVLRRGLPSVEILDQAQDSEVDLIVMGSEGLSGMGLILLGSVTERVVRKSPCSCLVVR